MDGRQSDHPYLLAQPLPANGTIRIHEKLLTHTSMICLTPLLEAISQIGNFCLVLYSVMYSRYGWT